MFLVGVTENGEDVISQDFNMYFYENYTIISFLHIYIYLVQMTWHQIQTHFPYSLKPNSLIFMCSSQ